MIPSPFEHIAASTVEEAVQALSEAGEDAEVLAGARACCQFCGYGCGPNDDRR